MCLAVPGKIMEITGQGEPTAMAKVNFAGVVREVSLGLTPEAKVGEYVIVHAGFAINLLDEEEAQRVLEELQKLQEAFNSEDKPS